MSCLLSRGQKRVPDPLEQELLTGSCELPGGSWKLNPGLLKEQQVPSSAKSPLQTVYSILNHTCPHVGTTFNTRTQQPKQPLQVHIPPLQHITDSGFGFSIYRSLLTSPWLPDVYVSIKHILCHQLFTCTLSCSLKCFSCQSYSRCSCNINVTF